MSDILLHMSDAEYDLWVKTEAPRQYFYSILYRHLGLHWEGTEEVFNRMIREIQK